MFDKYVFDKDSSVGICFGAFDLLHAGHITMLAEASLHCDYLVVGLQSDPTIDRPEKNKPIQGLFERYVQLSAVRYVDMIIPYDTEKDLLNILYSIPVEKRFLGSDYVGKPFTGDNVSDIDIVYIDRGHGFSSSELRKRINGK